ncbi:hypothetical protein Bbelb_073200 [Branchiostoma belcheri]|nr:hypothetical protein Bbelb_073200 [Branchiostoma belcheri]
MYEENICQQASDDSSHDANVHVHEVRNPPNAEEHQEPVNRPDPQQASEDTRPDSDVHKVRNPPNVEELHGITYGVITGFYLNRQGRQNGKGKDKGIEIQPRRSRRHPAQYLTDLDFADDLALVAELIKNAETLLQSLEEAASLNRYCFMVQKVGHLPVSFKNDWTGLIQNSCGGHRIYLGGNMPLSKKFMEDSQDCLKNSPTVELCSLDIVSEPSKKLFHLYSCGNHVDECTPEV